MILKIIISTTLSKIINSNMEIRNSFLAKIDLKIIEFIYFNGKIIIKPWAFWKNF